VLSVLLKIEEAGSGAVGRTGQGVLAALASASFSRFTVQKQAARKTSSPLGLPG
jgi:hypothetical protein